MDTTNRLVLPAAIIISGLILAVAIFVFRSDGGPSASAGDVSQTRPVSPEDHMIGNPEAKVKIVEYSDIDCRYCKGFQKTMAQLMTEYGTDGDVAWVYRHFPLVDIHRYAASHAEAAECVASIAGESSLWRFIDILHAAAPDVNQFNPRDYPGAISQLGVPEAEFTTCMDEGRFADRVQADFENALAAGGEGTPYIVVFVEGQEPVALEGALPYDAMKQVIDRSIQSATTATPGA